MQGSQQQQRQDSGKKRKKPEYVYGNYPFYYGYRVGKTLEEDPRVSVFKQEWIENRDCLDIGCNEGHVTIALAVKFCCKSMVGVDIDSKLIYKARCNLQHEVEALEKEEKSKEDERKVEDGERIAEEKCLEGIGTQKVGLKVAAAANDDGGENEKELATCHDDEKDGVEEKGIGKMRAAEEKDGVKHESMAAVESCEKEAERSFVEVVSVRTQGDNSVETATAVHFEGSENGVTEKEFLASHTSDGVEEKEKMEANRVEPAAKENGAQKTEETVFGVNGGSQANSMEEADEGYPFKQGGEQKNSGKTPSTDSEEAAVEQKAAKCGVVAGGKHTAKEAGDDVLSGLELSERVTFKTQNYLDVYCKPGTYDTILCLSISKWIHLNWGDEGLLKFFAKVFKELRPGGRLVLEPQPWESYSKKRRVSEVTRKNFQRIKLRPDNFPSILTEKIGFKFYEEISSELPSDKSGFRRPLFVYHK
ncbi:probable RNA methyltransferase At5g51130 [Selaginella moellendorffii]|uniref:probable RNA methyltransferase At5g51130 n=1 Tax=Selaginella moellendorffii TaxID=88036 RepID=UPI000D1D0769|nr:probable RNA methyltransferase At5g51130 [Selaginella moellendorffii]XP_024520518.1 probable RNA methyltransferase At5g51130 [Selaginella moellendorffii]|eukprot:XP_024520517.1 probable RNA methyltransferase At5g51130 [Selaginella moellendorffii]